jgi:hypothetical protein
MRYRFASGRALRIAWTCGLAGFFAFSNKVAAFWAALGLAPTTHRW